MGIISDRCARELDEITRNNDLINTFSWGESGFVENMQLNDVILETAESKERLDGCGWFSIVILYTIIW